MTSKVYYRSPVVWNMLLLILFSFLFLFLQEVFYNISSILNKEILIQFLKENKTIVGFMLLASITLYNMNKVSRFFTMLVIVSTFVKTCLNLNDEFSKMILVLLFFYLLLAYYMYQFFSMDIEESYYNPDFDKKLLFDPMLEKIECTLVDFEKEEEIASGYLTNWSFEGCYMYFESEVVALKGMYRLNINFSNHTFTEPCRIVSKLKTNKGCGLKFEVAKNRQNTQNLGWREFYEIIEHMGYAPELLR